MSKKISIEDCFDKDHFISLWCDPNISKKDIQNKSKKKISIDVIDRFAKELQLHKKITNRKKPSEKDILAFPKEKIKELAKTETFFNAKKIIKEYQKENNLISTYSFEYMCKFHGIKKQDFLTLKERRDLHNSHKPKKEIDGEVFKKMWDDPKTSLSDICDKFNISHCTASIRGKELGLSKKQTKHVIERKISNIFKDSQIKIVINDKTILSGKEIDIYFPEYKLGIEYNGLMFHSIGDSDYSMFDIEDTPKNRKKHLLKTEICEENGIQLFHIFENEWVDETKKEIWMSMIFNKLNKSKRIFARKCDIKEISNTEYKTFTEENHIQGYAPAKIKIGLYYNNNLVSVMSFSKGRNTISGKYEYEMIRMCSLKGVNVVGSTSKMFKYFIKNYNPKNIISFANRRWSSTLNNVYEKIGFKLSHISDPNYFYFTGKKHQRSKSLSGVLYSRNKFQKHKLKELLDDFDPNKTEWENMRDNGFRKIYDCGNLVYVWSPKEGEED